MATTQNPFKDLDAEGKNTIFMQLFSLGTNLNQSIDDKFELLKLICFLSYKMKEKDPLKFKTTLSVLQHLYGRNFVEKTGEDYYLISLSIICDDLLYGIKDIKKPDGFTNMSEICARIKDLVSQWMPF